MPVFFFKCIFFTTHPHLMTEGQTVQAKNLSEKEEMSTDWLLKYRNKKS